MDVIIRDAVPGDIPAMTDLLRALFEVEKDFRFDGEPQRRGLALMLERPGERCVKVAEVDGGVVGMCTAQVVISTAEGGPAALVEDMVVAASFRGRGIGPLLLDAVEAWASDRGCTRLQLLADRENLPAIRFYHSRDWTPTQLICIRKMV